MRFDGFSFGSIRIDGVSYDHDTVIARGEVRRRILRSRPHIHDLATPTF